MSEATRDPLPRVKVCGLTTAEDVALALDAGADACGFVHHPPSPRSVPLEVGVQIVREQIINVLRERGEIDPRITTQLSGASDQLEATRQALAGNLIVAVLIVRLAFGW